MYAVFDVNMSGKFKDPEDVDMKPVHAWLNTKENLYMLQRKKWYESGAIYLNKKECLFTGGVSASNRLTKML